jgi:hypothetical protein
MIRPPVRVVAVIRGEVVGNTFRWDPLSAAVAADLSPAGRGDLFAVTHARRRVAKNSE